MTQSCPLHLTIETPWGPIRFTMLFIVLPGGGDVVIIGQKTLREELRIDIMAQLRASMLKVHGLEDGLVMEITAGDAVGEPNAGAVVRAAIAVTAFGSGGDAPGDVDDDVTLAPLSQRPMMFQDSEMEVQDRVGALETAVNDEVDHGVRSECAKMLRDIVFRGFRTRLDVFRRALLGDPPAHVDPMTVRLQPGARAVRAKPLAPPIVHIPGDENCWRDLLSYWVTRPVGPVYARVKYTEVLFAGSDKFRTKEVVRGVQAAAAGAGPTLDTALGVASLDSEGLYRVEHHGHRVIWVPAGADSLKERMLVCAHLEGTGNRWVDATMARLEQHCVWDRGTTLPHFTVGDYVLVAPVSRHSKLMSSWTGRWRVANDDKEHVYAVQHLVTCLLYTSPSPRD